MDNDPASFVETARAGDPVAIARLLVATPSVNPSLAAGGDGERGVADVAASLMHAWGLAPRVVEVEPGRCNVIARIEGEGPTLLLNGHLDTVGVEGMTVDPFAARVSDGRLIGRGACDMKGGVASLMAAVARLARSDTRPSVVVALTADEEHASLGMAAFVRELTPCDFAIVCEPTSLRVMPAHKGFIWLRATFRGRAAHGSRPDIGVDAIRHAGLFLAALDGYAEDLRRRPPHPLLGHGSFHAGTISGGTAESVYPDRCELLLERRTLPEESLEQVAREIQDVLDGLHEREPTLDAFMETTLARPGTEVPADSPHVRGLLAAGEAHGVEPVVEGMTAWVDAAFLNGAGVPAVCYGPGSIAQAHTDDEWIGIAEIVTCANTIETFARSLVE
jgi:acetylornithine deacetylase